ncbi:MAG: HlyD family type I secretion periplasmic adaptor subunit [Roseibium sp.]|uniref:HlyD family type I secretion periplasmic adaptor subunit n=1 Tax=Roseibium sp. TaxID=1936156 RepID=UPI002625382D|nr:HlyD family type I secretion periplasmic adaptor subunit [Roseibium sp.]MCV0428733.1 HlyD family type I secretion periplasmic adaptor subunit [Roseibium sp.]
MSAAKREEAPIVQRQRSRDSYEFMPALLEVMDRPASPAGRLLVYIIATFFTVLVVWAMLGRVDIVAVASGTIRPIGGAVPVQARISGTIARISVQEGDQVQEGDILFTMDEREIVTRQGQIEERLMRHAMTARINARLLELLGAPIENRLADFILPPRLDSLLETQAQARFAAHQAEIDKLTVEIGELETRLEVTRDAVEKRRFTLPVYRVHEANLAALAERGLVRRAQFLEVQIALHQQEEVFLEKQGDLVNIQAQIKTLVATREARRQGARYTAVEALLEAQQAGSIALLEREQLATSAERSIVRAVRSGTVSEIGVSMGATVAQAGVAVMSLLPDDNLIVEARLPSRDIGFVTEGMSVAVKVDAYPFTRFGHIEGTITAISPDSTMLEGERQPAYTVDISLEANSLEVEGNTYPITSGMQVAVDIRTGDRVILDYFLSPIRASVSETLRER